MELLKVKEWKEKAGIDLFNYDGFAADYEKIAKKESTSFSEDVITRFSSAGELICGRRYFESKLNKCTMRLSSYDEYEKMVETIPNFVDSTVGTTIFGIFIELKKKHKEIENINLVSKMKKLFNKDKKDSLDENTIKSIKTILKLLRIKDKARNKSVFYAEVSNDECMVNLSLEDIPKNKQRTYKKYVGITETEAYDKLISSLESMLDNNKYHNISELPIELYDIYSILSRKRRKIVEEKSKEEMGDLYLIPQSEEKTDFTKTFGVITPDGINNGVVFNYSDDKGSIKGSIPISKEKREELDNADSNGSFNK